MKKSILIGKIANIHGIRGELKVYPYTDDIENLSNYLNEVYLDEDLNEKYIITRSRVHKGMLIIKLDKINDANTALTFKSKDIYIPKSDLKELEEGTYYIEDLLGCQIINEEDNTEIGKLIYVFNTGANDVYEVERKDKSKIYLPAISQVIKNVNISEKKIFVKLMEGLI